MKLEDKRDIQIIFRAFFDKEEDFNPENMSRCPTEIIRKGDIFSKSKGTVFEHFQYRYYMNQISDSDRSKEQDLINFLDENHLYLVSLKEVKVDYILEYYITLNGEMSAMGLENNAIDILSELECSVIMDLYP